MAAMATCTQAFAGLRLKASVKTAPAKFAAKATLGGKTVAKPVMMARATRGQSLVVRAEDGESAAAAPEDAAPEASTDEGDAPAPRGPYTTHVHPITAHSDATHALISGIKRPRVTPTASMTIFSGITSARDVRQRCKAHAPYTNTGGGTRVT